jgi:hypothetical protein
MYAGRDMQMAKTVKIEADVITAIENTLTKGDRVELIPVKDGVKVIKVKREQINTSPS